MNSSPATRREVFYSGNVQGVGFRFTTVGIAQRFPVTGYVENLPDGRVHLEAEGSTEAVDGLLNAIAAEMSGHIDDQQTTELPATGEFRTFGVRR